MAPIARGEYPLVGMGAAMALGGLLLVVDAAGGTLPVDPLLTAYALFVVAFGAGTVHSLREANAPGAVGYAAGVVGWAAAAAGYVTGRVVLVAFALAVLAASGVALFYLGLETSGLLDRAS